VPIPGKTAEPARAVEPVTTKTPPSPNAASIPASDITLFTGASSLTLLHTPSKTFTVNITAPTLFVAFCETPYNLSIDDKSATIDLFHIPGAILCGLLDEIISFFRKLCITVLLVDKVSLVNPKIFAGCSSIFRSNVKLLELLSTVFFSVMILDITLSASLGITKVVLLISLGLIIIPFEIDVALVALFMLFVLFDIVALVEGISGCVSLTFTGVTTFIVLEVTGVLIFGVVAGCVTFGVVFVAVLGATTGAGASGFVAYGFPTSQCSCTPYELK